MTPRTLLITGVSGYCGGTILSNIIKTRPFNLKISGLIRTEEQRVAITKLGISPVVFRDWDQSERLEHIAESFDIIIHAGAGWHPGVAKALITGQGKRRIKDGTDVHYMHLSGTTSLSDQPHTEGWIETRTFSDEDDIYNYVKMRQSYDKFPVRETDILVIEEGERRGVKTYIIQAPTIFGLGTGFFNQYSIQIPVITQSALKSGQVSVIGRGETAWSHVHVVDLALLFITLLTRISEHTMIPYGKKGIYFCETGTHTHLELSQRIARAGRELGLLKTEALTDIDIHQAAIMWSDGLLSHAEKAYGSNARTRAVLGRKLGWTPQHGEEWEGTFVKEISAIVKRPARSFQIPEMMQGAATLSQLKD